MTDELHDFFLNHYVKIIFFLIIVSSIVCFVLYQQSKLLGNEELSGFFLGLIVEIIGIFITFLLIDFIVKKKEEREFKRFERVFLKDLKICLYNQVEKIFIWSSFDDENSVDTLHKLTFSYFNDAYFEKMSKCDQESNIGLNGTKYFNYNMISIISNFKLELANLLHRFMIPYNFELYECLSDLSNHPIYKKLDLYLEQDLIEFEDKGSENDEIQNICNHPYYKDYIKLLIRACEKYNSLVPSHEWIFKAKNP